MNLSFVKDAHTYGKEMARNGPTMVIYKGTFISNQSLHLLSKRSNHEEDILNYVCSLIRESEL